MTKNSTFIQKIAIAFFLMLASQAMLAQNICDCDGTSHTPGVLTWLGDTYADDGAFAWEGQPVNFNCATWGYDCGDIAGAPTDDPYGVCSGNLPPLNGCSPNDILGCTDPLALNYNIDATVDDGSCVFVEGCTNPLANNFNPDAVVDDGSCTFDLICDCAGTAHTSGVLAWIGDTYADDGAYAWEGQPVDFNCATWGYDCGDIVGAPAEDPYGVCAGQLPPNNGCGAVVFGCTDPAANNYNPDATADDGSCMYDIAGCTDPTANNYDPMATIEDGSCTYGACSNLTLIAAQTPCTPDANDVLNPSVEFTFGFTGSCTVAEIIINLDGTEYPFTVDAPDNVSGSIFGLTGFPANVAYSAYYVLADGTPSDVFDFTVGDCTQDAVICDCDGNQHTIGVLSWLGDTYADNAAFTWAGVTVNFNCATWGYDCGDIAGAPAEDPYDVCGGNLPPNNGCGTVVFGCTDPAANNYNPDATADDGSCMFDIAGCTDPTANNYDPMATIDDGSCTYGACSNLTLIAEQTPCTPDANDVLNPSVEFTFGFTGSCTVAEIIINLDGTEYPFTVDAPDNVSGSIFGLTGFPANVAFSAYYILADGTPSDVFDFTVGDCSQDAVICDCDGNQHTIGVLSWLGDTYADNAAYTWAGVTVNFNCATWGYDCGDIAGAPAEDPYNVCGGNLPPNNGCSTTSVEEVASVLFEAYPNPTSGMLTLVNRGEGGNKQIRVFDQTGKLQLAEQRSMNAGASEQFNLSNLAAGTYHVQVVGNNGVSNITVIVQK